MYSAQGDGMSSEVVLTLCETYLDSGRTISTDNYYTSLPLAEALLQRRTHLVGTLRSNRKGLPREVCGARLQKGATVARENASGMVVLKW